MCKTETLPTHCVARLFMAANRGSRMLHSLPILGEVGPFIAFLQQEIKIGLERAGNITYDVYVCAGL